MSSQQVAAGALWSALSAVVGFITDKTGVKVIRGSSACTNGKSVTLPRLPEGMLSWREVTKVIAFLYHECAHILKSDFSLKPVSALHRAMTNVLEDVRIEKYAMLTFPAARKYLSELVRIMTEDGSESGNGFPPLTVEMGEAKVLQYYMLYRLRHDLLRQVAVKPAMDSAIAVANQMFPAGMMVRLDAMMFEVDRCETEEEVSNLSAEIMKMIKDEQEKAKNPPPPPPEGEQDQDSSSGESDSNTQGESGDSTDSASEGESSAGGDSAEQTPTNADSDGEGDDGSDSDASSGTTPDQGAGGTGDLENLLDMSEEDIIQSVGDLLGDQLDELAEEKRNSGSSVTMPNLMPITLAEAPVDMVSIKGAINATRTKTLAWMASAAQCDLKRDRKGILIDPTQLAMARTGGEIFVEEDEGIDINAAISIVIDRSGSMSSLIRSAANAALATTLAYDVQGIETQVSVFPVTGNVAGEYEEGVAVIKRWGEKPRALASRIGSIGTTGGTPMAEAVMFAASDILRKDESLKLIIVVTDGDPNDELATAQVLHAARQAGIVVVGLGIGVDTSRVFGQQFSGRLDDINALSGVMTKLVKAALNNQ